MNGEIKYRFALDDAGRSVDVFSLQSRENIAGRTFCCVGCKERMVAKLGTDVTHHFAHKPNSVCSEETYLHKLAKKVFQEEYGKCLAANEPFRIELVQSKVCSRYPGHSENTCYTKPRAQSHDLIPRYREIKVEIEKNEFVPDITLESRSGGNHVFIEIAVTHKCSEAKRCSQNRIIEIHVRCEDDLQPIRRHLLSSQDNRITFYNFKKVIPDKKMCSWFRFCSLEKKVFRLFKDGHWDVGRLGKDEELPNAGKDGIVWAKEIFVDRRNQPTTEAEAESELQSTLKDCVPDASEAGRVIRACGFCEHLDYWGTGECQKLDEPVQWRKAIDCEHFSMVAGKELMEILCDRF